MNDFPPLVYNAMQYPVFMQLKKVNYTQTRIFTLRFEYVYNFMGLICKVQWHY